MDIRSVQGHWFRTVATEVERIFSSWNERDLRSWMREFLVINPTCPWVTESFLYDIGETMGCRPLIMVHNPRAGVPLSYKQELRSKFWEKAVDLLSRKKLYLILTIISSNSQTAFYRFWNLKIQRVRD